jgi:geranylgeranyl pyrophosphate synthase
MGFALEAYLAECARQVEHALDRALPSPDEAPVELHRAMRHAALRGGKRLRPALAFAAAEASGGRLADAVPVATAVELVHAYSLVHDDLPAMDDAETRRGLPSVHAAFGEALAILAGDALLPLAFEVLATAGAPHEVIRRLARAAGSRALVGGQADDVAFSRTRAQEAQVRSIHARKTGALFEFSVWGGARLAGAGPEALEALGRFGRGFGAAFQIFDDLEDGALDEDCSILHVLDPSEAAARARQELGRACAALEPLGELADALRALADRIVLRLP